MPCTSDPKMKMRNQTYCFKPSLRKLIYCIKMFETTIPHYDHWSKQRVRNCGLFVKMKDVYGSYKVLDVKDKFWKALLGVN